MYSLACFSVCRLLMLMLVRSCGGSHRFSAVCRWSNWVRTRLEMGRSWLLACCSSKLSMLTMGASFRAMRPPPGLVFAKEYALVIRAQRVAQKIKECLGILLADSADVFAQEVFGDGGRNRSMLKDALVGGILGAGDDGAARNPGRNENCRYTNAQPIELKRQAGYVGGGIGSLEPIRRAAWRNHVIVEAAMLVVDNQQRGALPKLRNGADLVIDLADEVISGQHMMIGVLIISQNLAAARSGMI